MANVNLEQLNTRLRKRLSQLRQHQDPEEQFRLMKRYLSHFVKLVQIGRHFEDSFADHLRLVVIFLNDRRDKPLETDVLGTIVKTLCVICCITAAPYQTVVIALQGLLEIFERISCKETLQVIQHCGNHIKKLLSQFRRFGYFKIQLQLVELAYVASLSFSKQNERKDFVLELGRQIGGPLEQILGWQSLAMEQKCRVFINELQDKYPLFAAYSVPVEDARIGFYRLMKPMDSDDLWLDVNFKPATIRFSGRVTLIREKVPLEMTVYLEICYRDISRIDLKEETDLCFLSIEYTNITVEPKVLTVEQKGCLIFAILPSFDCSYLKDDVLPEVRANVDRVEDSEQPNTTNLDGLLNVSLLDSIVSGPANSLNGHNMEDQSPRLRDNRDAIEKHRNIRCQMLDNVSSIESNKENVKPPSSDVKVVVQDVQRLRVFESLQQDCQRQQTRLSRSSTRNSPDKRDHEKEQVNPRVNAGNKRKLFAKQAEQDNLNDSNDSQIQRSKYVEKKLVNTVKPIQTLDVKASKLVQNICDEQIDLLSEPSTSEMMSNDEFDRSLQAFIDHNGIFGIAQQKILDTKLEKNIRKINEMVERTTKKFFKREPAPENPYDFVNTDENNQTARKAGKNSAGKGKRKSQPKVNNENVSSAKKAKNDANQTLRTKKAKPTAPGKTKKQAPPKTADSLAPSRTSLPRTKKPSRIIDLASDSEEETFVIGNTFQNLDISSIAPDPVKPKNSGVKQVFAKSTPLDEAKSKKRSIAQTLDSLQEQADKEKVDSSSAKKQRVPLMEINAHRSNIVTRRDYRKAPIPSALRQMAAALIKQENSKAPSVASVSNHSAHTVISMEFTASSKPLPLQTAPLTEAMLRQRQSCDSDESIPQSLEVNSSPPVPPANTQPKTNTDLFASKFNMNYAKNRYTLKKFISNNNDTTYHSDEEVAHAHLASRPPNVGNESVLSENIRVGHDTAHPPSLRDDSIDLQSEFSVALKGVQHPYDDRTNQNRPTEFEKCSNDKDSRKIVSPSRADNLNNTQGSIVQTDVLKNLPSIEAMMMDEFSSKLHQELDPSLSDFEQKVNKLAGIRVAFEHNLSGLHINEINQKCVEIMSLEDRLDELLSELAALCTDAAQKADQITTGAEKLARYTDTKGNYYKERVQRARQEIPGIVDECMKNVWNQQVQIRLNQVGLLMTKMMM